VSVRHCGDTAVAVGTLTQRSTHRGNDASGEFRVTQIAVQHEGRWKLASLHFTSIAYR
jgi:ketosteroid isomerase-like protein